MMDLVLRLREARRLARLSQKDAAKLSGVGEKTISSMETGARIGSIKFEQLRRLLAVYGWTIDEFFSEKFEKRVEGHRLVEEESGVARLLFAIRELPGGPARPAPAFVQ
jgi:transcriptional regulator with XRE-family HTH domain